MTRTLLLLPFLGRLALAQCTMPAEIEALNREQVRSQIAAGHADFLLYKRLLDLTSPRPKPGILAPQFQKLYDAHPDDARFAYLSGRALIGKNTPEAIARLRKAVSLDPKLPWTYTALAEIHASPNFKDDASLLDAARNFRKVCPVSLEGFRYLDHVKDEREAGAQAAQLRRVLEAGAAPDEGRYWQILWGAEFRSAPESTYPSLRKRVVADVRRLESRPVRQQPALSFTLLEGYKLTGQTVEAARIEAGFEGPGAPVWKESRALEDKYGFRTRKDITREEREAFMRERGALAAEWVRKWPSSFFAWKMLLSALPYTANWTKEDLERAGARVLELDLQRDFGWTYISETLRVAQIWIRYGIQLKDSLRTAEDALAEFSLGPEEANDLTADSNTARSLASQRYGFDRSMWDAMGTVVDASVQLNDAVKARSMLGRMQNWLAENQERSEPGSGYEGFQNLGTIYAGKVAEAEGRKLDALAFYIKAISERWVRDEVVDHAKELWREQGRTMEAWAAVTTRPAQPKPAVSKTAAVTAPALSFAAFEKLERPLPQFQLRDVAGKVWTLDQFKGKRTFVSVWATWCGPCRQEFPSVQKLYELTKSRKDVQVITLNVDEENPGLVSPFLSANHVTVPVLLDARSYVMDFVGMLAMPQNWLVDRNGVLRVKAHGFDENLKDWPTRILEQLEQLQ